MTSANSLPLVSATSVGTKPAGSFVTQPLPPVFSPKAPIRPLWNTVSAFTLSSPLGIRYERAAAMGVSTGPPLVVSQPASPSCHGMGEPMVHDVCGLL